MRAAIVALVIVVASPLHRVGQMPRPDRGTLLENVAWPDAERLLSPESVVVIPLGAASLEHGPHLKLRTDLAVANYLARRVAKESAVVIAPAITYHYYPGFAEYPGSPSLSRDTAQTLTTDVVRGLARYGRFYVLNTSRSADQPLDLAARTLATAGLLLRYTRIEAALDNASRAVRRQPAGAHADEIETSMMLAIDPDSVDMSRAVRDVGTITNPLQLTRQPNGQGTYSASGTWGDATLATAQKGVVVLDALTRTIASDVDELRTAPLPPGTSPGPTLSNTVSSSAALAAIQAAATCSPGDERTIRQIGDAFTTYWTNQDATALALLWSSGGDFVHPDDLIERGRVVIEQNRRILFAQRMYRNSRHLLRLMRIRCLTSDVAVADGRWELRGLIDANNQPVPVLDGLCTAVVRRDGGGWSIEAYRYTINATKAPVPPTVKRPGYPGGAKSIGRWRSRRTRSRV
jgi:creatinine amidohydrolase